MLKKELTVKMEPCEMDAGEGQSLTASKKEVFDVEFWPGRRLTLSHFKGQILVHIREYATTDGKEFPTKRGACFTLGRLRALRDRVAVIDSMLQQLEVNASYNVTIGLDPVYKEHLGGGIYAVINEKYRGVDLRRYWMPPAQNILIIPTKNGIYLPATQWAALKSKLDELLIAYPDLMNATVCCNTHDGNQMELYNCRECTPFGYSCVDCI